LSCSRNSTQDLHDSLNTPKLSAILEDPHTEFNSYNALVSAGDQMEITLADSTEELAKPKTTRPAARQKGQKTRLAIIEEARRILVDEGYENFVLRKIAKNIGIQPGNLQYYYPTKNELLWEVLTPEIDKYEDNYEKIVAQGTSKAAKVLAMVDFLLKDITVKSTCNIWFTIWALAPHDKEVADIMDRFYQTYIGALAKLLQRSIPDLHPRRANHLARIITALMDGMTNQIGYGKPSHESLEGLENELRTAILHIVTID
jgi:AcrR family transcriptional regulator